MGKVSINELTLTNIGAAIREKTGKADLIAPGDMPAEIRGIVSGGGGGSDDCNGLHIPEEALALTGSCKYRFSYDCWNWFIENYGDKITTSNLEGLEYCFYSSDQLKRIPFEFNVKATMTSSISNTFSGCWSLENIPKINNLKINGIDNAFNACKKLESFPDDFAENWDWSVPASSTSAYTVPCNKMFYECYKLRSIPEGLLGRNKYNPMIYQTYSFYTQGFYACYCLENLENVPVHHKATWTGNAFQEFVSYCCRLKKLGFAVQEDGSPYVVSWKSQVLDLSSVGCFSNASTVSAYTGLTTDTLIDTEEKWRGYIDGTYPDGYSIGMAYSTFGKTAATNLINTLPDASAYLATAGGTNTIKFKTNAASAIPGENISELSEEVIAVAAAKGWTVTFA